MKQSNKVGILVLLRYTLFIPSSVSTDNFERQLFPPVFITVTPLFGAVVVMAIAHAAAWETASVKDRHIYWYLQKPQCNPLQRDIHNHS